MNTKERLPSTSPGRRSRQAYEKPRLRTIHMAAEEVLAVGCKMEGGPGGPVLPTCTTTPCFAAGS